MLSKNVDRWIEEWKAEGEAKGKAEGKAEGLRQVAKKLLADGTPVAKISEVTGLTEEEITALLDSIAH